jgi:hypothetical protein
MVAATAARGYMGETMEELLLLLDTSKVDILWMHILSVGDEQDNKENIDLTRFGATHRPTIRFLAIQEICSCTPMSFKLFESGSTERFGGMTGQQFSRTCYC